MKKIHFILLTVIFFMLPQAASGADISKQMESLAKKIIKSYRAKQKTVDILSVTVIPFQSKDEKLQKQHIGFGASELLTDYLVRAGHDSFSVIERGQLSRVLEEQQLSMSGIIDDKSAIQAGKLLGADFMVVGSVSRMQGEYVINARLVKTQTSEIIVAENVTCKIKQFNKIARPYISLSKNWALFYSIKSVSFELLYQDAKIGDQDVYVMVTGVRRMLGEHVTLEVTTPQFIYAQDMYDISSFGKYVSSIQQSTTISLASHLYWNQKLNQKKNLNLCLGGGVQLYHNSGDFSESQMIPSLKTGIDMEFKERIHFGIFGSYLLSDCSLDFNEYLNEKDMEKTEFTSKTKPLSFEVILGIYF
ncbi:FlgO family outer membrane protein [Elusimicrobiota bacterium]